MVSDFISDPKIFNIGSYSEKYTIGYLYADVSTDKCICMTGNAEELGEPASNQVP